jgi:DNA-binding GntR family transcriptional regulator
MSESQSERAYSRLEELIVTLQLAPGSPISESELCARTGFGRTPVREALQQLARQGLITILPRRGMVVTDINAEAQLQLLEFRRELEGLMVRMAARRRSRDEAYRFGEIASEMERAAVEGDEEAFMSLDRAYNELLGEACDNRFARASMAQWNPLSRRFWFRHHRRVGDLERMATLHAKVAWAVGAGDAAAAARANEALMGYLAGFTRATLEEMA